MIVFVYTLILLGGFLIGGSIDTDSRSNLVVTIIGGLLLMIGSALFGVFIL